MERERGEMKEEEAGFFEAEGAKNTPECIIALCARILTRSSSLGRQLIRAV
jgi:hypothetical protein